MRLAIIYDSEDSSVANFANRVAVENGVNGKQMGVKSLGRIPSINTSAKGIADLVEQMLDGTNFESGPTPSLK